MEGNGKAGSKVVCKIRIPLFEEKQRPIRGEGCRSNPYYPATRIIIIVKNRSLLLSDNNHANVCLRYVPNDASRQRTFVIVIRDLVHKDYLQFKVTIKMIYCVRLFCLAQRYNLRFTYCIFCSSLIFIR